MIIGLSGSHRTGKTTLARTFAEKHGVQFLETSVSAIFKELGKDPALPMTFTERLDVQEVVLERLEMMYASADLKTGSITDRTPLDLIAYTMADAIGDAVPEDQQERFAAYVNRCFDVTSRYFCTVALVQPGIALVAAEGKAAMNVAYIEHLNTLFHGLMSDKRLTIQGYHLARESVSMERRMNALEFIRERVTEKAVAELGAHTAEKRLTN